MCLRRRSRTKGLPWEGRLQQTRLRAFGLTSSTPVPPPFLRNFFPDPSTTLSCFPTMASRLKSLATLAQSAAASELVVKSPTATAFEATTSLRRQYVASTLNAMPARVDAAAAEWASLKAKVKDQSFTVADVTAGAVVGMELYACYIIGRTLGGRTIEQEL